MAFFKLRKAAGEPQAPAPAPESVDALRKRARYRLAGTAILVLAAVVGFPLLFDNQPRPIAVDIPIDIPDKTRVKPLVNANPVAEAKPADMAKQTVPVQTAAMPTATASHAAAGPLAVSPKASQAQAKEQPKEEVIISSSKSAEKVTDKPTEKVADKPAPKVADKPADNTADKAATGRFIVQFGAFTDSTRAHEARMKVEKTGLKTYAQIIEGTEGKKFRVRVGPFEKRSDAEKAADKIKKLDLPAAILGL